MTAVTAKITKAQIIDMSLNDLLGTPVAYVAPMQAAKVPRVSRVLMSAEEKKAARNEAQRLLRSTPEGKAYANAASKKSIALKKAKAEAELTRLKALVNDIFTVTPEETAQANEEAVAKVVVKKATKKPSKNSKAVIEAEDAPF